MRRLGTCGLIGFLALFISSAAHAALIAQFTGTTPSGNNTSYNYNLVFSTQGGLDRLEAGSGTITPGSVGSADFFTLYDIGVWGPVGNVVGFGTGAGFSGAIQLNTGINAAQTIPLDDTTLANLTWKYTGPTITTDSVFPGFSVVVKNNDGTTLRQFTAQYTDNEGPEINTKISEIGLVAVPQVGALIPEPSTMALGSLVLVGLMGRRKRR